MEEGPKIPWRMADLVETLLANNAENLRRQLEDCLAKLVVLCLLPLYSRLDQLGRLRDLGRMQEPGCSGLGSGLALGSGLGSGLGLGSGVGFGFGFGFGFGLWLWP